MTIRRALVVMVALAAVAATGWLSQREAPAGLITPISLLAPEARLRRALFKELRPVALENCTLERFGEKHDGGYLMCSNLLGSATAGYSYGISGYDGWGCDVSRRTGVTIHHLRLLQSAPPEMQRWIDGVPRRVRREPHVLRRQAAALRYDCQPTGAHRSGSKRVVMKMDVEGAEWESLLETPDDVLRRIDQLAIELHGVGEERFLTVVRKLKQRFHVANLHFNNYSCIEEVEPFPSWAYEVLFVNKAIAKIGTGHADTPSLDAPNNPTRPDCARPLPIVIRER